MSTLTLADIVPLSQILADVLELVNEPWVFGDMSKVRDFYVDSITAIREKNATLPILIHDAFRHLEWEWLLHRFPFTNVFMDTHLYHAFNVNDMASDNPDCDKSKQVAHENLACRYDSLLDFKDCISLPTFAGEFSLTIDNCIPDLQGSTSTANQVRSECQRAASAASQQAAAAAAAAAA